MFCIRQQVEPSDRTFGASPTPTSRACSLGVPYTLKPARFVFCSGAAINRPCSTKPWWDYPGFFTEPRKPWSANRSKE